MSEPVVRNLFSDQQPDTGPAAEDIGPDYVAAARAIAQICATRMLLMISVITGCLVWGFTIYEPERERLLAAIAFSVVFVGPMVSLYWKRG